MTDQEQTRPETGWMCEALSQLTWEIKEVVPGTRNAHDPGVGSQGSERRWQGPKPVATGPQSISPAECPKALEHVGWCPLLPVKVGWGILQNFTFQIPDN